MGRPPAGDSGEKVSGYARMTIRMKPATKARVKALCTVTKLPAWRIVEQALAGYIDNLPAEDRRAFDTLARKIKTRQK